MRRHGMVLFLSILGLCLSLAGCGKQGLEAEPEQWRLADFEGCFKDRFETAEETYAPILKKCLIPCLIIILWAILFIVFANVLEPFIILG